MLNCNTFELLVPGKPYSLFSVETEVFVRILNLKGKVYTFEFVTGMFKEMYVDIYTRSFRFQMHLAL